MTLKEEFEEKINKITTNNVLLELPTSFGKTKYALSFMANKKPKGKILIVIPRLVLIKNWIEEINKWKYTDYLSQIEFSTYISLPKKVGSYDFVIFDEVQHLSERCQEALDNFNIKNSVLLSATVKYSLKSDLKLLFKNLFVLKVSMKEAIDGEILPDPKVYLIKLSLDTKAKNWVIVQNPNGSPTVRVDYKDRFKSKNKNNRVEILCTQAQYIANLDNKISFWKRKFITHHNDGIKNIWLHKCGERLKWLSEQKSWVVLKILDKLKEERTLTFCTNTSQTELLGKYFINCKSVNNSKNLELFNAGKINHITACNMLNEGINLINCRIGIYANLNSSEIIIKQRLGRILRHKDPIIIIPYFEGTRDEELVDKMLVDYNPDLVYAINNINDLKV